MRIFLLQVASERMRDWEDQRRVFNERCPDVWKNDEHQSLLITIVNELALDGYIDALVRDKDGIPRPFEGQYWVTGKGADYLTQLQHPFKHWLKVNWAIASVAVAAIISACAALVSSIVSIVVKSL